MSLASYRQRGTSETNCIYWRLSNPSVEWEAFILSNKKIKYFMTLSEYFKPP